MGGETLAKRKDPDPPSSGFLKDEESGNRETKKQFVSTTIPVDPKRVRRLNNNKGAGRAHTGGPIIYWMSRDQRVEDNWALLYACEQAKKANAPVAVVFNLVPEYLNAGARQFGFMLRGLRQMEPKLKALNIKFFLLQGNPTETIPKLVNESEASLLVVDYSPLRLGRTWRSEVAEKLGDKCPVHEVDTHNIVPVWEASNKREYAARTIRPKINAKLPQFLTEFPKVPVQRVDWKSIACQSPKQEEIDWDGLLEDVLKRGAHVPEVTWCKPGEEAGWQALSAFLSKARLSKYATGRNNPSLPDALSGLSPYFHFGQLAPQRAALEASKLKAQHKASVEGFLEEMIVRRELSDNYCHYVPNYDSLDAAYDWARDTLNAHRNDKREFLYSREEFEKGKTHDPLWNAAQLEMTATGKMHGYIRMYWAKKILEWTASPEEAIEISIWLNDKWELDGRDPNGYVGCMWSVAGIHDQGWTERPIFGKIRYMNYAGCKRKFDVEKYCARVSALVARQRAASK